MSSFSRFVWNVVKSHVDMNFIGHECVLLSNSSVKTWCFLYIIKSEEICAIVEEFYVHATVYTCDDDEE